MKKKQKRIKKSAKDTKGKAGVKLGLERLLEEPQLLDKLRGKRVALIGSPASVDHQLKHAIDLLMAKAEVDLVAGFGAQHGLQGEVQDNMIETDDFIEPNHGIPIFSLYGKVRRPTEKMMQSFDVALFDIQDIGTRIYTYITTLGYMLEACADHGKELWVLDRPNPPGRPVEGLRLREGEESFVGLAPLAMRHGLTVGEIAKWYVDYKKLKVNFSVVEMKDYDPHMAPGFGWPQGELSWVNPSPNIPTLTSTRIFPGSVLLEGTTLSEGRGTTRALEVVGAPDIDFTAVLKEMAKMKEDWLRGCLIRPCYFEPTFHKHAGKTCKALQFHVETAAYKHEMFKPFRVFSLLLKAIRQLYPDYEIWRDFDYEYGGDRWAIDMLNGSSLLRDWVDDQAISVGDFEALLVKDESSWKSEREPYLLYR